MRFQVDFKATVQFPVGYQVPIAEIPNVQNLIATALTSHGLGNLPGGETEIEVDDLADLEAAAGAYLAAQAPHLSLGGFYRSDYWVVSPSQIRWYESYRVERDGAPLTVAVGNTDGTVALLMTLEHLP